MRIAAAQIKYCIRVEINTTYIDINQWLTNLHLLDLLSDYSFLQ